MTISTRRLRLLRGNSSAIAGFTGLQGELVFNTDTYTLHLQDGATAGGFSLATSAELANITANTNYGNSNVSSYLASNTNVEITVTGNISTNANLLANAYIGANSIVVGGANSSQQHSLLISNVNNVATFITGNRANGNTSIKLQANNTLNGIYIRNDNGSIGFNTIPSGPNIGYEFTFNGSVYASEFYTDANMPTGYQFTTIGDTGISHIDYGAVSAIRIRHDGAEAVAFYDNNTTEMRGNIVVSDGVSYGTYPNAFMQVYSNVNSYQQVVNQNLSNNVAASTDFVATADNGTDSTYFIDMGINSSQFNQASWFPAANTKNDGYLYVVGTNAAGPSAGNVANLIIGSTNGVVKTFVGNTADANVVTTVSTNLLTVSGNVTASYFIGNGSLLTGITTGTNYSNTNVAAYLTVYNGAILTNTINFSDSTVQTTAWKAGGNSAFSSNSIFVNNVAAGNFNNNGDFNVVFDAYTGGPSLNFSANYQSPLNSNVGITVQAVNTPIIMSNGNIELRANLSTAWTFDSTGDLTLPGSLSTPSNVTVNDTLFVVGSIQPTGASPAPYLSGFSSISTVISGNANEGNITAHNYLRANGGIITTGNITGGNLSISGNMTGNTAGFVIGYRDIPQVVFTSNATLALTDAGKHYYSANSANIITVPNNATVSFNIGTAISIVQQGTANLTVTPASGVTMYLAGNSTSASRTLGNYGMATLMKVATDTWFINGTGLT